MIFIILGTEKFQFNRLVKEIDDIKNEGLITDDVFFQLGSSTYKPSNCQWVDFLPFDQMVEKIKSSHMVIAHAGAGTTLLCLELDKHPIIVTRRKKYKEHIDDHQVPFAQMMEKLKYATVAYDVMELRKVFTDLTEKKESSVLVFKKDNSQIIGYLNSWFNCYTD